MKLFNGGHIAFKDIPLLAEKDFRGEVLLRCHDGARLANFFGSPVAGGSVRLIAILAFDEESELQILSAKIPEESPRYKSLTKELLQAHLFEREIAEQWAILPEGHPWLKPIRYHANYRGVPDLWKNIAQQTIPGSYPFYAVGGEEVHEVGVGPVHAGIIEPGHFRFQCHGE